MLPNGIFHQKRQRKFLNKSFMIKVKLLKSCCPNKIERFKGFEILLLFISIKHIKIVTATSIVVLQNSAKTSNN